MPSTQPLNQPFTFIIGCPRSGTTLLRAMLHSHSEIAVPPESYFILPALRYSPVNVEFDSKDRRAILDQILDQKSFEKWGLDRVDLLSIVEDDSIKDAAATVASVYAAFASLHGKKIAIDKTPHHTEHVGRLSRAYPDSRFIHLVRDGRDVIPSLQAMPYFPPKYRDAAMYWRERSLSGRGALAIVGSSRYHEVRYEDLLADPERELSRLCGFLGFEFEPEMLTYHERAESVIASMGNVDYHQNIRRAPAPTRDWRTDYDQRTLALFEAIAGDALAVFGYEPGPEPSWRQRAQAASLHSWSRFSKRFEQIRLRAASRLGRRVRGGPR